MRKTCLQEGTSCRSSRLVGRRSTTGSPGRSRGLRGCAIRNPSRFCLLWNDFPLEVIRLLLQKDCPSCEHSYGHWRHICDGCQSCATKRPKSGFPMECFDAVWTRKMLRENNLRQVLQVVDWHIAGILGLVSVLTNWMFWNDR